METCFICTTNLKHSDVVFRGKSKEDLPIVVHPACLANPNEVKTLDEIHIHIEPGKLISEAKKIIIKKRMRVLYKAIAQANRMVLEKKANEGQEAPST